MAYTPKRRRGPNRPKVAAVTPPEAADNSNAGMPAADEAPVRRRRPRTGQAAYKLSAPARPGYHRHWMNDDGNRIAEAHELGYDHVLDTGLKSSSPGSRISRLVGTKKNGEPLHAFLMETPDELYAEGVAEREAASRQIDEAILSGRDVTGTLETDGYRGAYGSIKSDR